MENLQLLSCKKRLEDIFKESFAVCDKYASRSPELAVRGASIRKLFSERLNDLNPKIMVYGIYNAGKSTLMNALVGENRAEVADVPTTSCITPYQWNEYVIYDTPGIDAPKEHEAVSKEHLEKCDVILFVLDSEGAFSAGKNYRELTDILLSRKKLLIILNNKSGWDLEKDVAEIEKVKSGIYSDFARCCPSGIKPEETIKIVVVDAKMALDARTDSSLQENDKLAMLAESNIQALEEAIVDEYSKATGFTVLEELAQKLTDGLQDYKELLKRLQTDTASKKGFEASEDLRHQQEQLYQYVSDLAKNRTSVLQNDIDNTMINATDSEIAKRKIEELLNQYGSDVLENFTQELQNAAGQMGDMVKDFRGIRGESLGGDFEVKAKPVLETLPTVAEDDKTPASTSFLNGKGGKEMLAACGTKLIPKAVLGTIATVPIIGPVVAPILPLVGPILLGIAAIKMLFGGNDKEAAERQRAERMQAIADAEARRQEAIARHKEECRDNSVSLARRVEYNLLTEIRRQIAEAVKPLRQTLQNEIAATKQATAEIVADLSKIDASLSELNVLVQEFKR